MKSAGLLLIVIVGSFGYTQAPDTLWTKVYGGVNDDWAYCVRQTTDGGYVIVGQINSSSSDGGDLWILKTDNNGDTLWAKIYGGTQADVGQSVIQTSDGGYAIAGHTYSIGTDSYDVWLLKTDSLGDTLWTKKYGGADSDYGGSIAQTADSGYIIAGATGSFSTGASDVYIVRTAGNGDTIWTRAYGTSSSDIGADVRSTSDNGCIVAGSTLQSGYYEAYLLRVDSFGDTVWTKRYSGALQTRCFALAANGSGWVIAGVTNLGINYDDVLLIGVADNGDSLWSKTYGGPLDDGAYSIQSTFDGEFIVTGFTSSFGGLGSEVWLLKTDSLGDTLWTNTWGGAYNQTGWCVEQTNDYEYIIVGSTQGSPYDFDVWLLKTEPDTLGIEAHKSADVINTYLQISPNPCRDMVDIRFRMEQIAKDAALTVYDATGRVVREFDNLVNQQILWNSTDEANRKLPSGVYFLKLRAGKYSATEKLLLIR